MSEEAKAQARAELAELEHIRELYANAYKSTMQAVEARRNEVENSQNNGEIDTSEGYNGSASHSLKSQYNEYNTLGMQWAYNSSTKIGDRKVLFNPRINKYVLVEATKDDVGFIELSFGTLKQMKGKLEYYEEQRARDNGETETVDKVLRDSEFGQDNNNGDNVDVGNRGKGMQNAEVSEGKSKSNGTADSQTTDGDLITKSYSLKEKWHTDLTKSQLEMVDGWLRRAGTPEAKKITDTTYWYKGRIAGKELFVIYSTEDSSGPTILYEVKGDKAQAELNILTELLEEIENEKRTRTVGKSAYAHWVSCSGWLQKGNNSKNNQTNLGTRSNNKNVGVLQGQSKSNGSGAFWNVIENLFGISDDRGISYSLKDAESNILSEEQHYTEKEYRNFGWARANNILNAGQNADYRSKFADAKVGRAKFVKSKKGEYIIPVSDIYDRDFEGVNNVLVFAKGTISNPIITSVIEIYEYDETSIDRIRRRIYDSERRGIQQKAGKLFGRYDASDFEFRPNQQRTGTESSGNSSNDGYGRRSGEEAASAQGETEVNLSLKGDTYVPSKRTKEFLDVVEDLRDGKENAADRLLRYVDSGRISTEIYEELIERYRDKICYLRERNILRPKA